MCHDSIAVVVRPKNEESVSKFSYQLDHYHTFCLTYSNLKQNYLFAHLSDTITLCVSFTSINSCSHGCVGTSCIVEQETVWVSTPSCGNVPD